MLLQIKKNINLLKMRRQSEDIKAKSTKGLTNDLMNKLNIIYKAKFFLQEYFKIIQYL